MLKWVFLSTFALTTVVLLAMGGLGYQKIHMNGRLCAAHSGFEADCRSCHVPWSRTAVRKAKCSSGDCHVSVRNEKAHVPPEVRTPCDACHTEHRGRAASATLPVDDRLCLECHRKNIEGTAHKFRAGCQSCHFYHLPCPKAPPMERVDANMKNPHGDHLEVVRTLLDLKEGESTCRHCHGVQEVKGAVRSATHEDCGGSECHQNMDRTKPSKDCKQCHIILDLAKERGGIAPHRGRGKARPVKRASVRFLHEDHWESPCERCHPDMAKPETRGGAGLLKPAECAGCHDEAGKATP
ncbi:MAG: hypothetical protein GXP25_20480 [Planctomycetes bacterium]|nr:hypothetical protein [Planctomycetota bacterium]